jgi:hypothetical protein
MNGLLLKDHLKSMWKGTSCIFSSRTQYWLLEGFSSKVYRDAPLAWAAHFQTINHVNYILLFFLLRLQGMRNNLEEEKHWVN